MNSCFFRKVALIALFSAVKFIGPLQVACVSLDNNSIGYATSPARCIYYFMWRGFNHWPEGDEEVNPSSLKITCPRK